MRVVLLIVGIVALLAGLLWAGQGMGWIMWPQSSFMLAQTRWAYIGGATALAGLILILYARRR